MSFQPTLSVRVNIQQRGHLQPVLFLIALPLHSRQTMQQGKLPRLLLNGMLCHARVAIISRCRKIVDSIQVSVHIQARAPNGQYLIFHIPQHITGAYRR